MTIFDIISVICGVLSIIDIIVVSISDHLFSKEHPKYFTVLLSLSVFSTALVSVFSTNIILEAFLT